MKKLLTILFLLIGLYPFANTLKSNGHVWHKYFSTYVITAPSDGHLIISGGYLPGDILQLRGTFKSVFIGNMSGTLANPIIIENYPGEVTTIGDPTWNNGSYAEAFTTANFHYFILQGTTTDRQSLIFHGSDTTNVNSFAYFDIRLDQYTDNFELKNFTIQQGGTGIWAKKEVVANDASSWFSSGNYQHNANVHDININATHNECVYFGHTGTFWNIVNNQPYYPSSPSDMTAVNDTTTYKQPIKWRNVHIYNMTITNGQVDGIQTAACDSLEIDHCEVAFCASRHVFSDNSGIMDGGRDCWVKIHDNYVHDHGGEMLQFYGQGGGYHIIQNNLFVRNTAEGISIRPTCGAAFGSPGGAVVQFLNNTVSECGEHNIRVNGFFDASPAAVIVNMDLLIQPPTDFFYTENGGTYTEGTGGNINAKYLTLAAANVDINNYYLPNGGSTVGAAGYRNSGTFSLPPSANAGNSQNITLPPSTTSLSGTGTPGSGHTITGYAWTLVSGPNTPTLVSPTSANTSVSNLIPGVYTFKLTVTQDDAQTANATVQVTVNSSPSAPTASAGADQMITLPATLTLSGTGTPSAGHTIPSHAWTKLSGPNIPVITTASNYTTTVTGLIPGTYVFRLTVTQDDSQTGSDDIQVTVNPSGIGFPSPKFGRVMFKQGH